jgi:hypothetical protein
MEAEKLYDHHISVLAEAKYLESITEDLIYETYRDAIICDHTRSFVDFKQEHRDIYIRLKMRGIRPFRLVKFGALPPKLGDNAHKQL